MVFAAPNKWSCFCCCSHMLSNCHCIKEPAYLAVFYVISPMFGLRLQANNDHATGVPDQLFWMDSKQEMKQITNMFWSYRAFEENQRDLFFILPAISHFKISRQIFDCFVMQTATDLPTSMLLYLDGLAGQDDQFCYFKSFPEKQKNYFGHLMAVCVAEQSNIHQLSLKLNLAGKIKKQVPPVLLKSMAKSKTYL